MRHIYIRRRETSIPVSRQISLTTFPGGFAEQRVVDEIHPGNRQRDSMISSIVQGDDVVFATPLCFGDSLRDIQSALRATLEKGATVRCIEPPHVVDGGALPAMRLLDDVVSAKRRGANAVRIARSPKGPKGAPKALPETSRSQAEADWRDTTIPRAEVAARYGVNERTLYRAFGPRETKESRSR